MLKKKKNKKPTNTNRSRVTNNKQFFVGRVDGRTMLGRRFRDLHSELVVYLGGADQLTECGRQLCKQLSFLWAQSEEMAGQLVAGQTVDHDTYLRTINVARRLARDLELSTPISEFVGDDDRCISRERR